MSFDWDVIRTTTDKLYDSLNDLDWDVHQIQYVGGRDWVIICRQEVEEGITHAAWASDVFQGTAAVDGDRWEIRIPVLDIVTWCQRAVDIQRIAEEAVSTVTGRDVGSFAVDIDVEIAGSSV